MVFGYNAVTSKIDWVRSPNSPQYAGTPLTLTGGQVMAFYKDGTASDITDSCGYEPDEGAPLNYAGEFSISARYTDHAGNLFTADTQIIVADVERLVFNSLDYETQSEYDPLNLCGASLTAVYTDGTTRPVDASSVIFSPAEGTTIGHMNPLSIQARWRNPATGREYYATHEIGVELYNSPEQVTFTSLDHAQQKEGDPLDLSGAVITAVFPDGRTRPIDLAEVTFEPGAGTIIGHYETLPIRAYWRDPNTQREYYAQYQLSVKTLPEITAIAGQHLSAGQAVYLRSSYVDTGSSFGNNASAGVSQNGDSMYVGESMSGNFFGTQVAAYRFSDSGWPVREDTFPFADKPTLPSGWKTGGTTNATFDTSRFLGIFICYKAGSNLYNSSAKTDLIGFLIVDKDSCSAVTDAPQIPNNGPLTGWNYLQKVAKPSGNSTYAAVLCRNTSGADKALVIDCLSGGSSYSDTAKIIDLGDTTDQSYTYYCTGPDEVYIAAYTNNSGTPVIKRASLSGGAVEDVFTVNNGDSYQAELVFLDDSRVGICNKTKCSFDIFDLSGELVERIQAESSFSNPMRPYYNSADQTVSYACNNSYVLRFDLREKTGRSILSASYAQQVSASDAFVLVYGSKSTSFEQYLYKKIYRAFPAGESTPSQGYALYEANSGETIRIVVTETGE